MAVEPNAWIHSKQRRVAELGLVTAAAPYIGLTALLATGALKLTDDSEKFFYEVERALLPNHTFTMRKLSNPQSQSRAARLCRKAMVDELPQITSIIHGDMALFGPRGAAPDHVGHTFRTVQQQDPELHDDALTVHKLQKAGLVSSYAIASHAANLEALDEEVRFPVGTALDANAHLRLSLDVADYRQGSLRYEIGLLAKCVGMIKENYGFYVSRAMATGSAQTSDT